MGHPALQEAVHSVLGAVASGCNYSFGGETRSWCDKCDRSCCPVEGSLSLGMGARGLEQWLHGREFCPWEPVGFPTIDNAHAAIIYQNCMQLNASCSVCEIHREPLLPNSNRLPLFLHSELPRHY